MQDQDFASNRLITAVLSVVLSFAIWLLPSTSLLADEENESAVSIVNENDPWEPFNRKIFAFNEVMDRYFMLPITRAYRWITPDPVEVAVTNFYNNLQELTTIANDLLQLQIVNAAANTTRFLVNTTAGVGGFFDVARHMGLERQINDFGQTFAHWGIGSGPYLMVPFLGPRTLRSGVGDVVEGYTTDILWLIDDETTRYTLIGLRYIDDRANLVQTETLITGDRYIFIRDAYLQYRHYLITGEVMADTFGDEDDDWDDDGWLDDDDEGGDADGDEEDDEGDDWDVDF